MSTHMSKHRRPSSLCIQSCPHIMSTHMSESCLHRCLRTCPHPCLQLRPGSDIAVRQEQTIKRRVYAHVYTHQNRPSRSTVLHACLYACLHTCSYTRACTCQNKCPYTCLFASPYTIVCTRQSHAVWSQKKEGKKCPRGKRDFRNDRLLYRTHVHTHTCRY